MSITTTIFVVSTMACGFFVTKVFFFSPTKHEEVTPLVNYVQSAGAGPLVNVRMEDMVQWFVKHQPITAEAEKRCEAIEPSAGASWRSSTEGRLCSAASRARFFAPVNIVTDDYSPPATILGGKAK